MDVLETVITWPHVSGIPKEDPQWSLNFLAAEGVPEASVEQHHLHLRDLFLQPADPNEGMRDSALVWFLGDLRLNQGGAGFGFVNFETYNLGFQPADADGPDRIVRLSPIFESQFQLAPQDAPADGNSLPGQVACCVSFHGNLVGVPERGPNNTRPASRRRGRMFVGRLDRSTSTSGGDPRPALGFRQCLNDVFKALADRTTRGPLHEAAPGDIDWCVFSDTSAIEQEVVDGNANQAFLVVGGSVDDSFDTIRKRKLRTTDATPWVAA